MSKIVIRCPVCGREQEVELGEYLFSIEHGGHPYTCGGDTCPSHTEMEPVDLGMAAYKEALRKCIGRGIL